MFKPPLVVFLLFTDICTLMFRTCLGPSQEMVELEIKPRSFWLQSNTISCHTSSLPIPIRNNVKAYFVVCDGYICHLFHGLHCLLLPPQFSLSLKCQTLSETIGVSKMIMIESLSSSSWYRGGVGKLWPTGPVWPTRCFCTTCKLRMVFILSNGWKKIKRRIFHDL